MAHLWKTPAETGQTMTKHAEIPTGCWPAVLRDEHAAYAGEKTVDAFLSRVGTIWPKPFSTPVQAKGSSERGGRSIWTGRSTRKRKRRAGGILMVPVEP